MNQSEFTEAAKDFLAASFGATYLRNVSTALSCGALNPEADLNYATLKAIALITAESFVDIRHQQSQEILENLRRFI